MKIILIYLKPQQIFEKVSSESNRFWLICEKLSFEVEFFFCGCLDWVILFDILLKEGIILCVLPLQLKWTGLTELSQNKMNSSDQCLFFVVYYYSSICVLLLYSVYLCLYVVYVYLFMHINKLCDALKITR